MNTDIKFAGGFRFLQKDPCCKRALPSRSWDQLRGSCFISVEQKAICQGQCLFSQERHFDTNFRQIKDAFQDYFPMLVHVAHTADEQTQSFAFASNAF